MEHYRGWGSMFRKLCPKKVQTECFTKFVLNLCEHSKDPSGPCEGMFTGIQTHPSLLQMINTKDLYFFSRPSTNDEENNETVKEPEVGPASFVMIRVGVVST